MVNTIKAETPSSYSLFTARRTGRLVVALKQVLGSEVNILMYRNLFFDVDDTLLDFEAGELKSLRATFEKHQIDYTDKLEKTYLRINAELWRQYE